LLVVAIGAAATLPASAQTGSQRSTQTSSQTSPATASKKIKIKVGDNYFKPKKVTITVGDTVLFQWIGTAIHDVKVKKGPQKWDSKPKASGKFSQVVLEPGKYRVVCTLHPGMEMKLTAKAPPPVTTSSSTPPAT
jgi:plastocyanin